MEDASCNPSRKFHGNCPVKLAFYHAPYLLLVVSCVLKKIPPRNGLKKRLMIASENPSACGTPQHSTSQRSGTNSTGNITVSPWW
jgi:hypothetical protein